MIGPGGGLVKISNLVNPAGDFPMKNSDEIQRISERGDIGGVVAKLDSKYGYASMRVSSYPSLFQKRATT